MKARRLTISPKTKRSRKFMFSFFRIPRIFRKRRVSRMSARQADPSNHGTKPKPSTTRYLESGLPSTATTMASASTNTRHASTTASTASSGKAPANTGSSIRDYSDEETVERDESWVRQLEEELRQRFEVQAQSIYEDHLVSLGKAGAFASQETRQELERQYEHRLKEMKQLQVEELEHYIERERQERLWSLDCHDPMWVGQITQEQEMILAQIRRDQLSSRSGGDQWNLPEKIWETQQEGEDTLRRDEEWQKSEPQRVRDREQWKNRWANGHIAARRERDLAEFEAHAAEERKKEEQRTRLAEEAKQGAAKLRARMSQATLNTDFDTSRRPFPLKTPVSETSSRSSTNESIFSSSPTADTLPSSAQNDRWVPSDTWPSTDPWPASSAHNDRWMPSDALPKQSTSRAVPISTPGQNDTRRSTSGAFSTPSPSSRARPAGTSTQSSPLSSTPFSNTTAHTKNDEQPPVKVWMPPDTAREPGGTPSRKASMQSDGRRDFPAKKTSMLFGESPGPPPPVPLTEPSIRSEPQQPRPVPTHRTRSTSSQSQSMRANPSSQPPLHAPTAPGIRVQPLPHQPPPKPQPGSSAPRSFSSSFADLKHSASTHTGAKSASAPMNPGVKPTPGVNPTSSADDYRAKKRAEYVQKEEERVEEERRRREQELNEKRAEEARRRGAEKRRQEEQAREAERREAERKTRKASINSIRPGSDISVPELWNAYEKQWEAMASAPQLRFRSIPWPVLAPISSPDMLLPIHIAAFILHPQHSQTKSRKDRLREALLRWHPDRFETKWLKKVAEEERDRVQEGVGCVVRALNDLLSAEGTFA